MAQLTLVTRTGTFQVPCETEVTIVKMAQKHKIPWGYMCERGICAQCRTRVEQGAEHLNEITPEEKLRLRKGERQEGYRLGCQIRLVRTGAVRLVHTPYGLG